MKKWVFGCLGLLVVAGVAAGVGSYFFIYKPAKAYIAQYTKLQEIPKLQAQVSNQSAFTPPANQELTPERVSRFLAVQQSVQAQLGPRVTELDAKYKQIEARLKADGTEASMREGLMALKDLVNLVIEAKRAQVNALNAANFSVAEYNWTRRTVYAASGIPMDFTLDRAIEDIAKGNVPDFESRSATELPPVPDKNRELVQPHLTQLSQNAGLAFFGL